MTQNATKPTEHPSKAKSIDVTVRFQFSHKEPFEREYKADQTAGTVRNDAMVYYEAAHDPNNEYYLTDSAGARVQDNATVGDLAKGKKQVKFKLNRRTTSGR